MPDDRQPQNLSEWWEPAELQHCPTCGHPRLIPVSPGQPPYRTCLECGVVIGIEHEPE